MVIYCLCNSSVTLCQVTYFIANLKQATLKDEIHSIAHTNFVVAIAVKVLNNYYDDGIQFIS
jgi:hypothetical protein